MSLRGVQKSRKIGKNGPRANFELKTGFTPVARVVGLQRQGSLKAAPSYAHVTEEGREAGRKRERSKERKRPEEKGQRPKAKGSKEERVQEVSEHAKGQRPGEFCFKSSFHIHHEQ